jgi:phosphate acetyltransferase
MKHAFFLAPAALSRVPLAGLILTGDTEIDQRVIEFCRPAFDTGLPLFRVTTNSYETATKLYQLSPEAPVDDLEAMAKSHDLELRAGIDILNPVAVQ